MTSSDEARGVGELQLDVENRAGWNGVECPAGAATAPASIVMLAMSGTWFICKKVLVAVYSVTEGAKLGSIGRTPPLTRSHSRVGMQPVSGEPAKPAGHCPHS